MTIAATAKLPRGKGSEKRTNKSIGHRAFAAHPTPMAEVMPHLAARNNSVSKRCTFLHHREQKRSHNHRTGLTPGAHPRATIAMVNRIVP